MALADSASRLDASYPAQAPQVAAIRRAVSALAVGRGAELTALTRIELAVSEAATNVVLHAYREPGAAGAIHVTAQIGVDGRLDVRVRDSGLGISPRPDSPGLGLGLSVMAQEADQLEIRTAPGGGTEVRLRFDIARGSGAVPVSSGRSQRPRSAGVPATA